VANLYVPTAAEAAYMNNAAWYPSHVGLKTLMKTFIYNYKLNMPQSYPSGAVGTVNYANVIGSLTTVNPANQFEGAFYYQMMMRNDTSCSNDLASSWVNYKVGGISYNSAGVSSRVTVILVAKEPFTISIISGSTMYNGAGNPGINMFSADLQIGSQSISVTGQWTGTTITRAGTATVTTCAQFPAPFAGYHNL
jgi:hypothetical protein